MVKAPETAVVILKVCAAAAPALSSAEVEAENQYWISESTFQWESAMTVFLASALLAEQTPPMEFLEAVAPSAQAPLSLSAFQAAAVSAPFERSDPEHFQLPISASFVPVPATDHQIVASG